MAANLTQILNFTVNFHQEFELFSKKNYSGSGLYSGGLTWSIVLRCDDHTGIFTCDGCARDPYFYVLSVTLELHSPTILFVIISGYNVPLRLFQWFVVVFPQF